MRWPFRIRSLATRLIVWSFVPTAIILFAVAMVNFYAYQRVTEDLVIGRNRELTRLSSSQITIALKEHTDLLMAARTPDMSDEATQIRDASLREARNRLSVFDGGTLILDSHGTVVAAEPERPDLLGQNLSNREYFRQLVRPLTPAPVFSDIISDGPQGSEVIAVAVPLVGAHGEFAGALVGLFKLGPTAVNSFYGGIVKLRVGDASGFCMVDSTGRIIFHADALQIGEDVSDRPYVAEVLDKRVGDMRTRDGEQDILASYSPIPGTSWGLVIAERWTNLTSSSQSYQQFLLVLLAMGVALPAVLVTMFIRRITGPISELTYAAKEVADGKFGRTITAHTGDELEDLAKQFNIMSRELQESYARLEQRVADRTRELATLNSVVAVASQSLELQDILDNALGEMVQAMNVEVGDAYSVEEKDQRLVPIAYCGVSESTMTRARTLSLTGGVSEEAVRTGRIVVKYVEDYPDGELKEFLGSQGFQTVVGVPLVAKGKVRGVIDLITRERREFTPEDLSLLTAIGQQVGVAVENAHLYDQAEESATAAERNRLARDLHDAVSQTLFSASLIADVLPRIWERNPDEGRRRLQELRQLTRGALAEMRTLLLELRPSALMEAPLGDLLKQLGESVTGRARIPVAVVIEGQPELPSDVKVSLYRIAQEALNNIAKHSGATQAAVTLIEQNGLVHLEISDDGRGFDQAMVPPDHLGLGIMRERAQGIGAILEIESTPGKGTRITSTWRNPEGEEADDGPNQSDDC